MSFNLVCFIHSGILYVIIFQVSGILIRNYSVERANEKNLKTLKILRHNSQAVTEIEAYQTLYEFIQKIRVSSRITLFYRREVSSSEIVWERLTKERFPLAPWNPGTVLWSSMGGNVW